MIRLSTRGNSTSPPIPSGLADRLVPGWTGRSTAATSRLNLIQVSAVGMKLPGRSSTSSSNLSAVSMPKVFDLTRLEAQLRRQRSGIRCPVGAGCDPAQHPQAIGLGQ